MSGTKLPFFSGARHESVTSWIFAIEAYFGFKAIDGDERKMQTATCALQKGAFEWFRMRQTNEATHIDAWNDFKVELTRAFRPVNHQQELRRELGRLRQTSDVLDYTFRFRTVVGQIEGMSELDQMYAYVGGLKGRTREEVLYQMPETLQDAIDIAEKFDRARFGPGLFPRRRQDNDPRRNDPPRRTETTPRQENRYPQRVTRGVPPERLTFAAALDEDTKAAYLRRGLCFRCGEHGHLSRDCPTRRSENDERPKNDQRQ